jgi:hypothetical protein
VLGGRRRLGRGGGGRAAPRPRWGGGAGGYPPSPPGWRGGIGGGPSCTRRPVSPLGRGGGPGGGGAGAGGCRRTALSRSSRAKVSAAGAGDGGGAGVGVGAECPGTVSAGSRSCSLCTISGDGGGAGADGSGGGGAAGRGGASTLRGGGAGGGGGGFGRIFGMPIGSQSGLWIGGACDPANIDESLVVRGRALSVSAGWGGGGVCTPSAAAGAAPGACSGPGAPAFWRMTRIAAWNVSPWALRNVAAMLLPSPTIAASTMAPSMCTSGRGLWRAAASA